MKDAPSYLAVFRHACEYLNQKRLQEGQIEVAVGEVLDCVYLKLYKKAWTHPKSHPLTAHSRIFFSVWINDKSLQENILHYNIHALKLRQLEGYRIESKKFAAEFRRRFKPYQKEWNNVSTDFGPLTLMEGWMPIDPSHFQHVVAGLGNRFIELAPLIDEVLTQYIKV